MLAGFLAERGLELSPEKTSLTHFSDGFDFLGQNIRRYHGKLGIQPAKKSRQALLDKFRAILNTHPTIPSEELIQQVNPILRGWTNYNRHICSNHTFRSIDPAIFKAL